MLDGRFVPAKRPNTGWELARQGDARPMSTYRTQREAARVGRRTAKREQTEFVLNGRKRPHPRPVELWQRSERPRVTRHSTPSRETCDRHRGGAADTRHDPCRNTWWAAEHRTRPGALTGTAGKRTWRQRPTGTSRCSLRLRRFAKATSPSVALLVEARD